MRKLHIRSIFAALTAIAVLLSLLVGCGSSKTDISPDASSEQTTGSPHEAEFDEVGEKNTEAVEKNMPVSIKLADSFSEGIAWVRYEDQSGNEQRGLLHTDGHIDPFPPDAATQVDWMENFPSTLGSQFSGGYSYFTTVGSLKGIFVIVNQAGEITALSPNDGSSYEILCGGDGVYLVKQSVRSMTENEDRYGFISGNGNWINECTICEAGGVHPLSLDVVPSNFDNKNISFSYLGDGIFQAEYHNGKSGSMYYHRYGVVLYNTYSKRNFVVDSNTTSVFTDSSGGPVGNYSNGFVPVKSNGELYMLSADFELTPITVDTTNTVFYSDGIIFTANCNRSGNRVSWLTDAKFYRTDGSVLADLSQYELRYEDAYELYRYNDGYAAVIICGVGGGVYLGILDSEGNFTFEPKEIDVSTNLDQIGIFSSGVIVVSIENRTKIINVVGEEMQSDYLDQTAHIDYDHYVFKDGYCGIMGTNGKLLEPYIDTY